jgi:hypothetical protein
MEVQRVFMEVQRVFMGVQNPEGYSTVLFQQS